jgi:hypothetical protein
MTSKFLVRTARVHRQLTVIGIQLAHKIARYRSKLYGPTEIISEDGEVIALYVNGLLQERR